MKKTLVLLSALALVGGLLGCGGSSSKDDCGDISKKACEKLYGCGYFFSLDGVTPVSQDVCTNQVEALLAANGSTDEQCRNEWDTGGDLACAEYFIWFNQE